MSIRTCPRCGGSAKEPHLPGLKASLEGALAISSKVPAPSNKVPLLTLAVVCAVNELSGLCDNCTGRMVA